jgi:hypothetical protein
MSRIKNASPALVISILALVAALVVPAVAQVATKALSKREKRVVRNISTKQANKQINRRAPGIADNQITSRAPGLSVASADNAANAQSADTANSATTAADADQLGGLNPNTFVQTALANVPGQPAGGPVGSTVRQIDFRTALSTQNLWYLGTLRWTFMCDGTNLTSIRVFNTDPVTARIWIRWSQAGSTSSNVEALAVTDSAPTEVMASFADDAIADFSYVNANGMQVTGTFHARATTGGVFSSLACMVGGTAIVTP